MALFWRNKCICVVGILLNFSTLPIGKKNLRPSQQQEFYCRHSPNARTMVAIFMRHLAIISLILVSSKASSQLKFANDISGYYISTDSKFEKSSELTLTYDSSFIYFYMLGGCQDKIKGKWTIKNGSIILHSQVKDKLDSFFTVNLNNTIWTIEKKGLKPKATIDNGCFKESALHVKQ